MATCKDCLHYERCKWVAQNIRAAGRTIEFDDDNIPAERYCEHFKNKADVVEVVRCSQCKYLKVYNNDNVYAECEKIHLLFRPFETDTREHFCGFGERKCEDGK